MKVLVVAMTVLFAAGCSSMDNQNASVSDIALDAAIDERKELPPDAPAGSCVASIGADAGSESCPFISRDTLRPMAAACAQPGRICGYADCRAPYALTICYCGTDVDAGTATWVCAPADP